MIHDWDDETSIAILKVVRNAIAPRGQVAAVGNDAEAGPTFAVSTAVGPEHDASHGRAANAPKRNIGLFTEQRDSS